MWTENWVISSSFSFWMFAISFRIVACNRFYRSQEKPSSRVVSKNGCGKEGFKGVICYSQVVFSLYPGNNGHSTTSHIKVKAKESDCSVLWYSHDRWTDKLPSHFPINDSRLSGKPMKQMLNEAWNINQTVPMTRSDLMKTKLFNSRFN